MITKSKLGAVPELAELTEAQITAIEKLSKNDEQITIDENRSAYWKKLDEDIQETFGLDKPHGIKSHVNFKTVLAGIKKDKDKVDELKAKITEKDTEITTLQEQVKKGSNDEALKAQITKLEGERDTLKNEVTDYKTKYTEKEAEVAKIASEKESELLGLQLKSKYSAALANPDNKIKFNPNIPEAVVKRELAAAEQRIAARGTASLQDDGTGNKTLVFLNKDGVVLKNKSKGLDPYSAEDLYLEELQTSGILEGKREKKGGGTNPPKPTPGGDGDVTIDVSSATTQVEAVGLIHKGLLANGIAKTDPKFNQEAARIMKESSVSELPEQ